MIAALRARRPAAAAVAPCEARRPAAIPVTAIVGVPPIELVQLAEPGAVAVARRAAAAFAAGCGADDSAVALCISDAVTDVVLHAYDPGAPGLVRLWGGFDPVRRRVVFDVTDDGAPRDASADAVAALPIVARLAVGLERTVGDRGTRTTIWFRTSAVRTR